MLTLRFTSVLTSPSLLKVKQTVLTMPHWDLTQAHASYLLIALMILICMSAALFGLILAMVVNIFLNSGLMDYIISIVMVLVFAGLIA